MISDQVKQSNRLIVLLKFIKSVVRFKNVT